MSNSAEALRRPDPVNFFRDAFDVEALQAVEHDLRDGLGAGGEVAPEDLIVQAMRAYSGRPKVYKNAEHSVLTGRPTDYHAFYEPDVANVLGFVHSAVGERFQVRRLGLARLETLPFIEEMGDVELLTDLDELNRTHVLPSFAARNIGKHPANFGTSVDDVAGHWYIQLNFAGQPGPQNFFNAVQAVRSHQQN